MVLQSRSRCALTAITCGMILVACLMTSCNRNHSADGSNRNKSGHGSHGENPGNKALTDADKKKELEKAIAIDLTQSPKNKARLESLLPEGIKLDHLSKQNTLYLLYSPVDLRTDSILFPVRHLVDEAQYLKAQSIVGSFHLEFEKLIAKRSAALSAAQSDPDLEKTLLDIRVEIFQLRNTIFKKIFVNVLTKEQQDWVMEKYPKK
jgi:hypothetical protein